MQRRLLIIGSAALIAIVGGFLLFRFLTSSTISIEITGLPDQVSPTVAVGEYIVQPNPEGMYEATVNAGNHNIFVKAGGYEDGTASTRTFFRNNTILQIAMSPLTADAVAAEIAGQSGEGTVKNAQFYGNNDWVVFNTMGSGKEGGTTVARYVSDGSRWQVVTQGTVLYFGEVRSEVPAQLLKDLSGDIGD